MWARDACPSESRDHLAVSDPALRRECHVLIANGLMMQWFKIAYADVRRVVTRRFSLWKKVGETHGTRTSEMKWPDNNEARQDNGRHVSRSCFVTFRDAGEERWKNSRARGVKNTHLIIKVYFEEQNILLYRIRRRVRGIDSAVCEDRALPHRWGRDGDFDRSNSPLAQCVDQIR